MGRGRPVTVNATRLVSVRVTNQMYENIVKLGKGNFTAGVRELIRLDEVKEGRRRGNVNDFD